MTWLISESPALLPELGRHAVSLGISGLLFVMWWTERQERTKGASQTAEALQQTGRQSELNQQLLDVLRSNTEALVALRSEIRSQREALHEWTQRISQQVEHLKG
jgi:hypothetical protein